MVIFDNILLVLFCLIAVLPPLLNGSWDIWALTLIHLSTLVLLLGFWLRSAYQKKSLSLDFTPSGIYFLFYLLFCFISYFHSVNHFNSRNENFNQFNYFLLFLLSANLLVSDSKRAFFRYTFFGVTAFISLLALWQKLHHQSPVGTLLNENVLSAYLVAVFPLFLSEIWSQWRIVKIFGALVVLLALFSTRSLGGAISLGLGVIIFFILGAKFTKVTRKLGLKKIVVTGISCFAVIVIFLSAAKLQETNVYDRVNWWRGALEIIKDHPFSGVGLGNFGNIYLKYKVGKLNSLYAHNHYLELWSEIGFLGVLAFLLGIYRFIKESLANLRKLEQSNQILNIGIITSVLSLLLYSFIDFGLAIPAVAIIFWVLMGLSYSYSQSSFICLKINWIRSLIFAVLILVTGVLVVRPFLASQKYVAGIYSLRNNDLEQAEKKLIASIKIDSLNAQTYAFLSDVYKNKGNLEQAIYNLKEAIKLNSNYGSFHYNLARVYETQGNLEQAIAEARLAIACHPQKPLYHQALSILYKKAGDDKAAQYEERKLQELLPSVSNN